MNLVKQAMEFATRKHVLEPEHPQLYAKILPYTHHPAAVAAILKGYGLDDEELIAAAWLHDVLEDTDASRREINERFGTEVGSLVWAVTAEKGENRKVRNALTYPKIRERGPRAVALKLADRLANVQFGGDAIDMYKKEHADFRHGIYVTEYPEPFSVDFYTDQTYRAIAYMQVELDEILDWA